MTHDLTPHPTNGRWRVWDDDARHADVAELSRGDLLDVCVDGAWRAGRVEYDLERATYVFTGQTGWPLLADLRAYPVRVPRNEE